MPVFKNYYEILGVEHFADVESVRSAFRKLARQYHPDLNSNNRAAEEKFKEINEAYEVLSNPDKRAMHDAALKAMGQGRAKNGKQTGKTGGTSRAPEKKPPPKQAARPSEPAPESEKQSKSASTPINELFESFLKKGFSEMGGKADAEEGIFRPRRDARDPKEKPKRGEDVVVKTAITPAEAMDGVVKTVNVQHNELCRRCSGTGKVSGAVCTACQGEKMQTRLKKIDVRIPAGVKTGSRVRVAREGGRGAGGAENGDLFLQIEIAYDPSLRVEGLDVHGEVALSVTEAVLGGEIDVPTLHGPVKMAVPPGTQAGRVFRLKERGVHSGSAKGDHFVTVVIVVPEDLSPRERELYQELARLRPEKPTLKKNRPPSP